MSTASRLLALRQMLEENGTAALLVSKPENVCYLSGFNGSAGFLILTQRAAVLATDFRYIEQARRQAPDYEIVRIGGELGGSLPQVMKRLGEQRLGFEASHITYASYNRLAEACKGEVQLTPVEGIVEKIRAVKSGAELALIEKAAGLADRAFEHIKAALRPGMNEKQAAWEIEKFMRDNGAGGASFDIIVASGPNSALPHARPGERPIAEGESIVFDLGARYEGYCSDLTRTICLGRADGTFRKVYDLVLGAQLTALATLQSGMTGASADQLARTVVEQGGHGDNFGHGLGHGVGLEIHEAPRVGTNSSDILKDGMVFTVEPGVYVPGWGGVRIEDMVVLENGRPRLLTHCAK